MKKALKWIVLSKSKVEELYLVWDYFRFERYVREGVGKNITQEQIDSLNIEV